MVGLEAEQMVGVLQRQYCVLVSLPDSTARIGSVQCVVGYVNRRRREYCSCRRSVYTLNVENLSAAHDQDAYLPSIETVRTPELCWLNGVRKAVSVPFSTRVAVEGAQ